MPLVTVPLVTVPLVTVPLVTVPLVTVPLVTVPLVTLPLVTVPCYARVHLVSATTPKTEHVWRKTAMMRHHDSKVAR